MPLVNKWPSEQRYVVVGCELRVMHGKREFVYHIAHYDFSRLSFQTRSHVPQKMLKPVAKT